MDNQNLEYRNMRRKSSIPVENKAAKEAAKTKMFAALSRKTGLTAKEVDIQFLATLVALHLTPVSE